MANLALGKRGNCLQLPAHCLIAGPEAALVHIGRLPQLGHCGLVPARGAEGPSRSGKPYSHGSRRYSGAVRVASKAGLGPNVMLYLCT